MSYERIEIGNLRVGTMPHDSGNVTLTFTHYDPYHSINFDFEHDEWLRFVEFVSTYPATVGDACSAPGPDPCEDCAQGVAQGAE